MDNSLLTLFCLVDGRPSSRAFEIEVSKSRTIAHLKDLIKAKQTPAFDDITVDQLTLWRVSIQIARDNCEIPILLNNITEREKEKLYLADDISDIFYKKPPKKTIHILVQRPPRGLSFQTPQPLFRTTGFNWTYQPDSNLHNTLRPAIRAHYNDFYHGLRDKSTIPLYLFLSGAGTGKSRNAQEFHRSAVSCLTENDQELRERMEQAWVFHVSLENGTSPLIQELDPIEAVGNRMLLQLLPNKCLNDVVGTYENVLPMHVLKLIATRTGQDLKSATVILVVDGLQSFMSNPNDGLDKESAFYRALTNIGDLANRDVFMMVCCTATVTTPVDKALASTHRNRIVLPVASLEPPRITRNGLSIPVFDEDDHIINVLVNDCGGHGRALESLLIAIQESGQDFSVELLMNNLHRKLQNLYSEALLIQSSTVQAMARAILTRVYLDPDKPLPGTTKLPGELAIPGLIRYEQPNGLGAGGYLVAPYIWVWLFSYQPREGADPLLNNWRFCDYPDLRSKMDPRSPPGAQFWQHFEHFVATFRCLKSKVLEDGKPTTISAIHTGARLNGDISFKNHHLKLAISSQYVDTKSPSHRLLSTVRCEHEELSVRNGKHCIINAPSAPFGDSFTGLDARRFCTEVHQCKLTTNRKEIDFQMERQKAASDKDFFMLFTIADCLDIELPPLSGIVDKSNWELYFGPFAGRAFVFATTGPLDINLATRKDLKRMRGVDDKKADLIIQERSRRRFDSCEDAAQRLRGVGENVLKRFKFPQSS
ncbi:hypothetical protein EC991_002560 [Linnemannia zychae]|nr:hypothetical protein EC991_002560 [Linnemannia zychae]